MHRLSVLVLLVLTGQVAAVVQLTYSQLFDQEDFRGKTEIVLTKCSGGCFVYAAAPVAEGRYQTDIVLVKKVNGVIAQNITTLRDLSRLRSTDPYQPYLRKPVVLDAGSQYSFVNRAPVPADAIGALAIYAVASTIPNLPFPNAVPVYDSPPVALEAKMTGNGQAFGVLAITRFSLTGLAIPGATGVSIRTSGYDSVVETTCKPFFTTPISLSQTTSFRVPIRSPLLTVAWANAVPFSASITGGAQQRVVLDLYTVSLVTSPGFIGCGAAAGNYRHLSDATNLQTSARFISNDRLNVSYAAVPNLLTGDSILVIGNGVTPPVNITGSNGVVKKFTMDGTEFQVMWGNTQSQSYWAVALKADALLNPFDNPTSPKPPPSTTKAASVSQVTLLAFVSLMIALL